MLCNNSGQTIQSGKKRCPNCGTVAPAGDMGFFSFGEDLLAAEENNLAADVSAAETVGVETHACGVCGGQITGNRCPACGFDSSCDYEQHPTLQNIPLNAPAVSQLKEQWEAAAVPAVELAVAFLRRHRWEAHVVAAVEEILESAAAGEFTEQHHIEIQKDNAASKNAEETDRLKSLPKLSQFCATCGTSNDEGRLYCVGCGVKLHSFTKKTAAQKTDADNQRKADKVVLSNFCKHCGGHMLSGAIYCTLCGHKAK